MRLLLFLTLFACDANNKAIVEEDIETDLDGDGVLEADGDCDDSDPMTFAGAEEICDGIDNDCDGDIDEELDQTFYVDEDNDGYGDDNQPVSTCNPTIHVANIGGDCNDQDQSVSPSAHEICDGIDNNCDGAIDLNAVDAVILYEDQDEDGFGNSEVSTASCDAVEGYVENALDCNDLNATIAPDQDEICDGKDNDCDGLEDEADAIDITVWYADDDEDGFGDASSPSISCDAPSKHVSNTLDCDDQDPNIHPNADEECDGIDNNCDAMIDGTDSTDVQVWYQDGDGDGYGDANDTQLSCYTPTGFVADSTDCDDTNSSMYPTATEVCDGVDNNCDGQTDGGVQTTYYLDIDGDGFGTSSILACALPAGYATNSGDCDDDNNVVYPNANEICDGLDNSCNGHIDEDDSLYDTASDIVYYFDGDGDGFGETSTTLLACASPGTEYVLIGQDCDDQNSNIAPDSIDECNGIDDNCDGFIDENFVDVDGIYSFDDHCGGCNTLCDDEIANGIGQCVLDANQAPYCEVVSCDPGYTMFPNCEGCGLEVQAYQAQGRPGHCGWSTTPTYCSSSSSLLGSCWQNGFTYSTCIIGYNCPGASDGDTSFSVQGACSSYF